MTCFVREKHLASLVSTSGSKLQASLGTSIQASGGLRANPVLKRHMQCGHSASERLAHDTPFLEFGKTAVHCWS